MKTETITVNKTEDNPKGIDLEIVKPTTSLEQRLLSHILVPYIKQAKERGAIPYDLPDSFTVEYLREGTFLAQAGGASSAGFYEPPKPIAIFGLRTAGRGFDLIHAEAARRAGEQKAEGDAGKAEAKADDAKTEETPVASDSSDG